jgi:hypothetical protein
MATAKVTPFTVFPQLHTAPEQISQLEIEMFLSLQNQLAKLQAQIDAEEETLKARIAAGASVEPGVHIAELKENIRRNVAWKSVVIRLADRLKLDGVAYCARVLAATKPTKTVSLDVH